MNFHALAFLALFGLFSILAFRRSSWGIPLYFLTFYASPPQWWWGKDFLSAFGPRWSLAASLIFALAVLRERGRQESDAHMLSQPSMRVLLLYAMNATAVYLALAVLPEESWFAVQFLWKELLLVLLIVLAARDEYDLKVFLYSIIGGGLFLCCEVYLFDVGRMIHGRLEHVRLPSGSDSNYLSAILCFSLILCGYYALQGKRLQRLLAIPACALMVEIILRCVSRGTMLALLVGGAWLVFVSKGRARLYALAGVVLAMLAAFLIMGDHDQQKVLGRFATTFNEKEKRDASAEERVLFWGRALQMLRDYPLGSGAEAAFASDRGRTYIRDIRDEPRAIHNGYLDIATSWGLQGLALYLAAFLLALRQIQHAVSAARARGRLDLAFLGCCIQTILIASLTSSMFISSFKGEWYFWWMAMALSFSRVIGTLEPSACGCQERLGRQGHRDATGLDYPFETGGCLSLEHGGAHQ